MRRASPDSSRPTVTRFHRACCAAGSSAVTSVAPPRSAAPVSAPARSTHQRRAPAPPCPPAAPLHRSTHHCRARRAHHRRVRRTRQPRRPPCPFCRCRYPLCCSPQRRYPPRRPIKPRIPSLHCGGPRAQLARIAPYASPFPRMRAISPLPGSIFASCMLFGVKMARSSPHVSIPGCDRAVLDAWRGNLAVKGGFSRRGVRDHAWREELASAARPLRGSGL